jgi:dehydrogenase/reductase SDR family member 7B
MAISFKEKIVWITGASSGIGEALAYEFAKEGSILILSSRRKEELEKVAQSCNSLGGKSFVFPLDLSDQSVVEEVADKVLSAFGHIDILVNNGGISQRSLVIETPVEVDRRIMEIDYFSGVILTKKVLPAMVERGYGHFIVISSITGKFGFTLRSAYAAAKHALHGFYESVWAELHSKGIHVTMVCPGRIHTNISMSALTKSGQPHGIMDHAQAGGISAEQCAQKIMKGVKKQKIEVYIAGKEMLMIYFKRYIPWLFFKLVSRVKPT